MYHQFWENFSLFGHTICKKEAFEVQKWLRARLFCIKLFLSIGSKFDGDLWGKALGDLVRASHPSCVHHSLPVLSLDLARRRCCLCHLPQRERRGIEIPMATMTEAGERIYCWNLMRHRRPEDARKTSSRPRPKRTSWRRRQQAAAGSSPRFPLLATFPIIHGLDRGLLGLRRRETFSSNIYMIGRATRTSARNGTASASSAFCLPLPSSVMVGTL
jgi:hypothetical protein